jgi:hypothetical protein
MQVNNAIELLRDDNLVWSDDFDSIRHDLADLLVSIQLVIDAASAITGELIDEG